MAEHRIRLRGGWECHYREGGDDGIDVVRRIDLPTAVGLPAAFRLNRHFGKPPVDAQVEAVTLEIKGVDGLKSVRLNGRAIGVASASGQAWTVDLDPGQLLPRNGLVLEFDRGEAVPGIEIGESGWGEVALVIRPR